MNKTGFEEAKELVTGVRYIHLGSQFPRIVCLCGSTRFHEAFRKAALEETIHGKIVLTIGCNLRSDEDLFGDLTEHEYLHTKEKLDLLHLRKIDLADEVLVLNVEGYIGFSTNRELEYALKKEKVVRFLEKGYIYDTASGKIVS